jgi:hypothetical protein
MRERIAEELPGLVTAQHAAAYVDQQRMFRDHARMLRDGYRSMAKAAGMQDVIGEGGDMGDTFQTIITGDIADSQAAPWRKPEQPAASNGISKLVAAAIAAAALVGGAGGTTLVGWLLNRGSPPAVSGGQGTDGFQVNLLDDLARPAPRPAPQPSGP